jgi:parallel beta-helix repeat protein
MVAVICNIRLVRASGPIYIRADGTVEPIGAPIQRNGDIYILTDNVTSQADGIIIEKSSITFDGSGYTVQGGAGGNGFYLHGINNVTIRNARTEGFNYGIYLESTSRNVVSQNDIKASTYDGIGLYDAANNTVSYNSIKENDWSGIGLYFSTGNNISANYISNSYYGMNCFSSQENWIFHNNFVANTNQTSSDGLPNAWDNSYPSGGNYWSDYIGTDVYSGPNQNQPGSDGIGDTSYNVSENNQDGYPLMQKWTNIAITAISSSKTAVGQGQKVNITVVVQNQGVDAVTTSVTLYANTTILSSFTNIALSGRTQTTLTYTWQTGSFDKAKYVISANATAIPGETNTADNTYTYGLVSVMIMGDIDGNGWVNVLDAIDLSNSFGKSIGQTGFNPDADFDDNGVVNILDAITLANHYNQHYP